MDTQRGASAVDATSLAEPVEQFFGGGGGSGEEGVFALKLRSVGSSFEDSVAGGAVGDWDSSLVDRNPPTVETTGGIWGPVLDARPVAELFGPLDSVFFIVSAPLSEGWVSSSGDSDSAVVQGWLGGGGGGRGGSSDPSGGGGGGGIGSSSSSGRTSSSGLTSSSSGGGGGSAGGGGWSKPASGGAGALFGPLGDDLFVLHWNDGLVMFEGVADHEKAGESVELRAQVTDAAVQSYSWDLSQAPNATNVTGTSSYRLQFQWNSSLPQKVTEYITLTVTLADGTRVSQRLTFVVEPNPGGGGSGGSGGTSSGVWPVVLEPGKLATAQAGVAGGSALRPYQVELGDGSLEYFWSMPSYNPGVSSAALVYDSVAAEPDPIFTVNYELDPSRSVPDRVAARLTFNGVTGSWVYYDTSRMNPGNVVQLALQADRTGLVTGRYSYTVEVVPYYGGMAGTSQSYSGSAVVVSSEGSELGEGWRFVGTDRLVTVTGGVILARADGSSLWYAQNSGGGYTSPPGDFATLVRNTDGTYTRTLKTGERQHFNSAGLQTSFVDRNGNVVSYSYVDGDSDGLRDELSGITDPNGLQTTLSYGPGGRVAVLRDPAGREARFSYDTAGQLVGITQPDGTQWTFRYTADGRLSGVTDPAGKSTSFSYGKGGRIAGISRADGSGEGYQALVTVGLAGSGEGTASSPLPAVLKAAAVARYTDPLGKVWEDRLDWYGFGLVVQATDAMGTVSGPAGHMSLVERDQHGLPVVSVDRLSRKTEFAYDSRGNVIRLTAPDGAKWQYSYNTLSLLTQEMDPLGRVTDYIRDSRGNLTELRLPDPDGSGPQPRPVWSYTYTTDGWVQSEGDPLGRTTRYERDSRDRVTRVIFPDDDTDPNNNPSVQYGYDAASNVIWTVNERGHRTEFSYDVMDRLVRTTYPDDDGDPANNPFSTVSYDAAGNVIVVTNERGHQTRYEYDALYRLVKQLDPDEDADPSNNPVWQTVYDAAGQVVGSVDPLGRRTQYGYNDLGYLISVTTPLGFVSRYEPDAEGQVLSVTDPLGRGTRYQYDVRGRVVKVIDPAGQEHTYGYDSVGRTTSSTDASGGTTSYGYNDLDQLVSVQDALRNVWRREYDLVGNLVAAVDPLGNRWEWVYDARNRMVQARDPLGNVTQYVYCSCGTLEGVRDPLGRETRYEYNARLWRTAVLLPDGTPTDWGDNPRVQFTYDAAGNRTSLRDADGNVTQGSTMPGTMRCGRPTR
jgi:YD repeat-containing protein